jgi:predicted DNA-binding protein with PD1-like motif
MIEARTEREMVVRMADGEDLVVGLMELPIESGIVVCGIGMLREIELGYWTGECYEKHRVEPPVELVSLQGTIARLADERVVHLHACVAQRDGSTQGGHLFAATVHNTAEIAFSLPQGIVLERRTEETGLTGLYPRLRSTFEDTG